MLHTKQCCLLQSVVYCIVLFIVECLGLDRVVYCVYCVQHGDVYCQFFIHLSLEDWIYHCQCSQLHAMNIDHGTPKGVHYLKEILHTSSRCQNNENVWKSLGCTMVNGVP